MKVDWQAYSADSLTEGKYSTSTYWTESCVVHTAGSDVLRIRKISLVRLITKCGLYMNYFLQDLHLKK